MCCSDDHYDTNPGSQATYNNSHKIDFSLWPKWVRTVKYGILVIKKPVETLQIGLYSVFLDMPMKHVQEEEKGKETWL